MLVYCWVTVMKSTIPEKKFLFPVSTRFGSRSFAVAVPTIWNSLWLFAVVFPFTVFSTNSKLFSTTLLSGLLNAPLQPAPQIQRVSR